MPSAQKRGSGAAGEVIRVDLSMGEHRLLQLLPARLRAVLTDPESHPELLDRLFPMTHADPKEEAEHRRLLGQSMLEYRSELLMSFEATLARARLARGASIDLSQAEVDLWLHVINDFRLLIGVELGIEDNDWFRTPPRTASEAASRQFLFVLSGLQEAMIGALGMGGAQETGSESDGSGNGGDG